MTAEAQRPVVLAVDDSTDLLALMAKALTAEYQVRTAEAGSAALKLALARPQPALILLDVEMPGESGFDVCRQLKGNPQTAEIPVIFLTGKSEAQAQVEGLKLGAVDYITKPINAAVLKARVRMHLQLAGRQAELERMVGERTAQLESTRTELIKRLARWNTINARPAPLSATLRSEIRDGMVADIERLGFVLKRDLSHWITDPADAARPLPAAGRRLVHGPILADAATAQHVR